MSGTQSIDHDGDRSFLHMFYLEGKIYNQMKKTKFSTEYHHQYASICWNLMSVQHQQVVYFLWGEKKLKQATALTQITDDCLRHVDNQKFAALRAAHIQIQAMHTQQKASNWATDRLLREIIQRRTRNEALEVRRLPIPVSGQLSLSRFWKRKSAFP